MRQSDKNKTFSTYRNPHTNNITVIHFNTHIPPSFDFASVPIFHFPRLLDVKPV